ncbi:hypothetical protein J6590_005404 [Homalodisca vitripennis]|nr:hypothetical protein J6590_005404 [Homalodisca vitripennis]
MYLEAYNFAYSLNEVFYTTRGVKESINASLNNNLTITKEEKRLYLLVSDEPKRQQHSNMKGRLHACNNGMRIAQPRYLDSILCEKAFCKVEKGQSCTVTARRQHSNIKGCLQTCSDGMRIAQPQYLDSFLCEKALCKVEKGQSCTVTARRQHSNMKGCLHTPAATA